jgi:hypothetical protein
MAVHRCKQSRVLPSTTMPSNPADLHRNVLQTPLQQQPPLRFVVQLSVNWQGGALMPVCALAVVSVQ